MVVIFIVVLLFVVVVGGIALINQSAALVAQSSALAMNSATSLIAQCTLSFLILGVLGLVGYLLYRRFRQQQKRADRILIVTPGYPQITGSGLPKLTDAPQYALPDSSNQYPLFDEPQAELALPAPQDPDFWREKAPWES